MMKEDQKIDYENFDFEKYNSAKSGKISVHELTYDELKQFNLMIEEENRIAYEELVRLEEENQRLVEEILQQEAEKKALLKKITQKGLLHKLPKMTLCMIDTDELLRL